VLIAVGAVIALFRYKTGMLATLGVAAMTGVVLYVVFPS
jgi:hypothetical protein